MSRGKKITPGKRITPADLTQTVAQAIGTSSGNTKKHTGKETTPSIPPQSEYDAHMSDVEPDTDEAQMSHSDHDETTMNSSEQPADYRPSQWVVVKYASKRSVSYYLGQVMEKVYDGVEITFLKSSARK
jgi:hypothetical protein